MNNRIELPQGQPEPHNESKTKTLKLRKIPMDVYKLILKHQGIKKTECGCQYSMEQTIYSLIRRACKVNATEVKNNKIKDNE